MRRSCAVLAASLLLGGVLLPSGLRGQDRAAPVRVPDGNGRPILVDGLFSPGEWDDAMAIQVRPDLQLLLKKTSEYVFLGLKYSPFVDSSVDLFISPDGKAIHQLHVSAQLGEILLTGPGSEAGPSPFVWGATSDWYANEIRWDAKKAEALMKQGTARYEAQGAVLYRYDGFEFQIRRSKFGSDAWLIRLESSMPVGEDVVYPAGTAPASTDGWLSLELGPPHATGQQPSAAEGSSAGQFVAGLYDLVSSTGGGRLPDWDKVRACFLKEAVVVLRTSRTALTSFTLDGFIKDFVDFYERPFKRGDTTVVPKDSGFAEKVLRSKVWVYGDMAHVLVLYEAQITGFPMAPQRGVDSWLLVRRDGRWLIAAATNEIVTAERPIPPELRDGG